MAPTHILRLKLTSYQCHAKLTTHYKLAKFNEFNCTNPGFYSTNPYKVST